MSYLAGWLLRGGGAGVLGLPAGWGAVGAGFVGSPESGRTTELECEAW